MQELDQNVGPLAIKLTLGMKNKINLLREGHFQIVFRIGANCKSFCSCDANVPVKYFHCVWSRVPFVH